MANSKVMNALHRPAAAFAIGLIVGMVIAAGLFWVLESQYQRMQYDAHLVAAAAARKSGDNFSAEAHYFAAEKMVDEDYVSFIGLGELFESQHRDDEARRMYESALQRIDIRMKHASEQERKMIQYDRNKVVSHLSLITGR